MQLGTASKHMHKLMGKNMTTNSEGVEPGQRTNEKRTS